jgi:hypothetical protein
MNPLYLILYVVVIALGIAGLIKIFSGAFLIGIGLLVGSFVCGTIGGLLMNGGKWG